MKAAAFKEIPLSRGMVARVSPDDYARLSIYKWCVCFEGSSLKPYAVRFEREKAPHWKKKRKIKMHREVLRLPRTFEPVFGLVGHHDDGDGLNNVQENLRAVTFTENARLANARKRGKVEPFL